MEKIKNLKRKLIGLNEKLSMITKNLEPIEKPEMEPILVFEEFMYEFRKLEAFFKKDSDKETKDPFINELAKLILLEDEELFSGRLLSAKAIFKNDEFTVAVGYLNRKIEISDAKKLISKKTTEKIVAEEVIGNEEDMRVFINNLIVFMLDIEKKIQELIETYCQEEVRQDAFEAPIQPKKKGRWAKIFFFTI
jgi:hypothetical protein